MSIAVELHGTVATVTLDRPPNNHVDAPTLTALADALERLDADPTCRAVVLASTGRVFCGGADLAPAGLLEGGEAGLTDFYAQVVRLFRTAKPIVAALQGSAVGAGLGLALVADLRVAAPPARLVGNFVKLGFHAGFGLSHTLPRLIGVQRSGLMLLTGRRVRAEDALAWGLVDALVPVDDLLAAARALAEEIAVNAPLAVVSSRATLRAGLADAVRAALVHELAEQARLMETDDFAEGLQAVKERREGRFEGR